MRNVEQDTRSVIIIGSGPSGLTAAVYAARANLAPLGIEGFEAGGQLMLTTEVENYPGFVDGIMGPELMEQMRKQAARFGAEYLSENVTSVDFSASPFEIRVSGSSFRAHAVIIATGAQARMLGIPGEKELLGRGVSTCATCDGFFFRDLELIVVGGGDSALEEAIFLTKFASKIMRDRAFANPKIDFVWNSTVSEVYGDKKVDGAHLFNLETGETSSIEVGGVFLSLIHI